MDIYASDEEKAEEIKRWWRENGKTVIIAVLFGFSLIFAARAWMSYQHNQVVQASLVYQQVMSSLAENDQEQAATATDGLLTEYPNSIYSVLSALQMASVVEDQQQVNQYLQWVMQNAELDAHKSLARLRLARVEATQGEADKALALISAQQSAAYASLFAELEGDVYQKQGDNTAALAAYQRAIETIELGDSRQTLLQLKLDDVAVANES
jgi:predicted negative regulator of RcsB-dependent stress response